MDTTTIFIASAVGLVVLIGLGLAVAFARKQRSKKLREEFGSEYERVVETTRDKRQAEDELEERKKRVESYEIRPLSPQETEHFADDWASTQSKFVDQPSAAVGEADRLVKEVMRARGYPMANFEQRAADISVDYPDLVSNYRAAREIAEKNELGQASTEDLRQAMVHYRALFEELLKSHQPTNGRDKHAQERMVEKKS